MATSTGSLASQRHPGKFPKVPGRRRGTNSRSLPKLMSNEPVMPSSHLIPCRPLLLLPPIPPSMRVRSGLPFGPRSQASLQKAQVPGPGEPRPHARFQERLSDLATAAILGGIGGRSRRGQQRMRWLDGIQRMSRRDKKAFLREQCKEIEENNRMGKIRPCAWRGGARPGSRVTGGD